MTHTAIISVLSVIISLISPMLLLSAEKTDAKETLVILEESKPAQMEEKQSIFVHTGTEIEEIDLEDYLVGVVLSEMLPSFHEEALKAQAVAARTFALHQKKRKHGEFDLCNDSSCCQAWTDINNMKDKLGDSFERYWMKAEKAVNDTKGEVMTYNGDLIEAVYFSCSGGRTESAVAVWGTDVPYLRSVASSGEEQASKFKTTVEVDLKTFHDRILSENDRADLPEGSLKWIGEIKRSEGGGVERVKIGGQFFAGSQLRKLFGLASTNFTMQQSERCVTFSVSGYGHRVGMSQYGANAMAERGKTYQEILQHYYTGVTIKNCSDQ